MMRNPEMVPPPFKAAPQKPEQLKPVEAPVERQFNVARYDGYIEEMKSKIRAFQGELEAMGLGPEVYTVDNEDLFVFRAIRSFIRQHGLKWVKRDMLRDSDPEVPDATYVSDSLGRARVIYDWMKRDEKELETVTRDLRLYRESRPDRVTWSTLKKAMDELEAEGVTKEYLEDHEIEDKRVAGRADARRARTAGLLPPIGKTGEEMEASFGVSESPFNPSSSEEER